MVGTAFRHYCGNMIILAMRINLVTPFAEKDAVKALGTRWDAATKVAARDCVVAHHWFGSFEKVIITGSSDSL